MSVKLFIGGLSWNTDNNSLRAKFEEFGAVEDAIVIRDRETGRSRGFGFVVYSNNDEATAAVNAMNDVEFDGRIIRVQKATEREGGNTGRGNGGGFSSYNRSGNGGSSRYAGSNYTPRRSDPSSAEGY